MTPVGTVRPATAADVDAVVELEQTLPGRRRVVARAGRAGDRLRAADRLVPGGRGGRRGRRARGGERRGDDAELQRIAVDPAYRRRGLASELLEAVEARAAADGATRLLLEVREDNTPAAAFYESRGFEEVGRRRGYYRDGAAAVVLGKKVGHRGSTASLGDS